MAAVDPNGEVIVLDSAGYGSFTVVKSVSVIAPQGVYAGISVFTGDGVTVSAGINDKVVLRGLTINGQGGINGIHVTTGGETFIEDCTVANLMGDGILVEGGSAVHIARVVARKNNASGILVLPSTATTITATLVDSTLTGNAGDGFGALTFNAGSTIDAAVSRVAASYNDKGLQANSTNTGTVTMAVVNSVATENGSYGVGATGTNTTVSVSGSSLGGNIVHDLLQSSSAVLRTAGNNALTGRGAADVSGTLTPNPLK
jgi:hypothetical protein